MKLTSAAVFLEPAYQDNGTDLARSGGSFSCIPLPPTQGKPKSWTSEAMSTTCIVVIELAPIMFTPSARSLQKSYAHST